mgnify:CR=1 FL=1
MESLETILVLDFGSQYSRLIARRVREAQVFSEILPYNTPVEKIKELAPKGIILSGGPSSVYGEGAPRCQKEVFELGLPILGICYGMQLTTLMLGGAVVPAERREYGRAVLKIADAQSLFKDLPSSIEVWMSHGDHVDQVPPGFKVIASTDNAPVAAMVDEERQIYGIQFHPEVAHTPLGFDILQNFIYTTSKCRPSWTPGSFITQEIAEIRKTVGNRKVLCALSGGVDSTVAAVLIHRAIGDNLVCVFVDNGLLRKDEAINVSTLLKEKFQLNLVTVDATDRFLSKLEGVTDPEEKRKIIGHEFISVFEEEAAKLGEVDFLVQGTLYPDVIESVSEHGPAAKIKSHHNVGGLPEHLRFKLLEPFRLLFKDDVRLIGGELGLPEEVIWRQPFPGPGLAVRIIGAITREKLTVLREADRIVTDEIKQAGYYRKLWQSFAVLTDTKSVGVMGDERTYDYVVAVRAVTSEDAMTADWARLPYDLLDRISRRIINEVSGVNRVVYDITSKPPGTIEWE